MVNIHGSGMPVSNPNLLINPWFQINQRAQSAYSGQGYTVDRWHLTAADGTVTTRAGGIDTVTLNGGFFRQSIENDALLADKTVTLSLECENVTGAVYLTEAGATADTHRDVALSNGISAYTFNVADAGLYGVFVWGTGSFRPLRAKLELGPVSTLAYDSPPDLATEKLKCQRYYEVIANENTKTTGYHTKMLCAVDNRCCIVLQPWKVTKRVRPTVMVNGACEGQKVKFRCSSDDSFAEGTLVSWNEAYLGGYMTVEMGDIVTAFQPGKIYEATIIGDAEIY